MTFLRRSLLAAARPRLPPRSRAPAHAAGLVASPAWTSPGFPLVSVAVQGCSAHVRRAGLLGHRERHAPCRRARSRPRTRTGRRPSRWRSTPRDSMKGAPLRDALAAAHDVRGRQAPGRPRRAVHLRQGRGRGPSRSPPTAAARRRRSSSVAVLAPSRARPCTTPSRQASDDLATAPGGRRVLVVLSDGGDSSSTRLAPCAAPRRARCRRASVSSVASADPLDEDRAAAAAREPPPADGSTRPRA